MSIETNSEPADLAVIAKVLAGRKNDYEVLVLKYQHTIFSLIMRQTGDEPLANDLTQEVFVKAYQALPAFKANSAFSTWLIRIALNTTSSYFASSKHKERTTQVEYDQSRHDRADTDHKGALRREFFCRVLQQEVGNMKPKFREVVVLCGLEGKTYEEAANILKIPLGTVCSRMNTALNTLRGKFARLAP